MDPSTGEVLSRRSRSRTCRPARSATGTSPTTFEPGSTFKLVVASAALEESVARPDDVFEASATGAAVVVPGTTFHDVHRAATYTFADAVRWSSNIVMGRLGLKLGPSGSTATRRRSGSVASPASTSPAKREGGCAVPTTGRCARRPPSPSVTRSRSRRCSSRSPMRRSPTAACSCDRCWRARFATARARWCSA